MVMFIGSDNGVSIGAMTLPLSLVNTCNKYSNRAVNHSISATKFNFPCDYLVYTEKIITFMTMDIFRHA